MSQIEAKLVWMNIIYSTIQRVGPALPVEDYLKDYDPETWAAR